MYVNVWVGCVSHYNAGKLIGEWVDALDALDWKCPEPDGCEETWVYDHEIPGVDGELTPALAVEWGRLFEDVPESEAPAVIAYLKAAEIRDPLEFDVDEYRDRYYGEWRSIEDYAWSTLDVFKVPNGFELSVDTVAWEQDFSLVDGYLFRTH